MKLRDELKNRADKLDAEMIAVAAKRDELLHEHNVLFMQRDDLERAIAALTPAPIVSTDEGWELEPGPAELFEAEKSEAREQLEREDDASEFAAPMPDPEFVVLDEQTCEPVEEAPALNEQMQDEREEPVALPQPEWNEPEAHIQAVEAERYALATNPEADAIAKAHDYYSPEKVADRNRFNPFAIFKREDA